MGIVIRNDYIHLTPGRIRLQVPGLRGNNPLARRIEYQLSTIKGISSIKVNPLVGSVLVYYNQNQIDGFSIIIYVDGQRNSLPVLNNKDIALPVQGEDKQIWPAQDNKRDTNYEVLPVSGQPESMVPLRKLKVGLLGTLLGFFFIKHIFFGRSSLSSSKTLANVATIIGLILSYPVFLWSLKHPKQSKRLDYDFLINFVTLTLIVLQEDTTALVIALLINSSKLIMAIHLDKARRVINKLGTLPRQTLKLQNNHEFLVPIEQIEIGETIVIHRGQTIPVDGTVLMGRAQVDERELTDLPQHVYKESGAKVFAGTAVLSGDLSVKVERKGMDTQIYRAIKNTRIRKPPLDEFTQRPRIDRMIYLSMFVAGGIYLLTRDARRSLAVLIAANPSAAGLAATTATGFAIDQAVDRGIYIKEGEYLRETSAVDIVAFDKTGTLTHTEGTVHDIIVIDQQYSQEDIIRFASLVHGLPMNPVTHAISKQAVNMDIGPLTTIQNIEVLPGLGLKAKIKGQDIFIGNESLMSGQNISLRRAEAKLLRFSQLGLRIIFVAVDGKLCGLFTVKEHIKSHSREAVEGLRAMGIDRILILSTDTKESVVTIGKHVGITETYGELGPDDKAKVIRSLEEQGHRVTMVGDGFDDVLALAEAESGIAFSSKAVDPAARAAEIAIPSRDPKLVLDTFRLAHKTREVIKQNLNFALGLNMIGLGLGAVGLLSPVGAAFLENVGTVGVLFNSRYQKWL